jgi:hypothetical protein
MYVQIYEVGAKLIALSIGSWNDAQKYAASVKGILHRMLNNMVLWIHSLGRNDGLLMGGGFYII